MKENIVALVYDFDGTLCPGNMQEYGLIQALGFSIPEFWEKSNQIAQDTLASGVIAYMKLIVDAAREKGIALTKETLTSFGRDVELYPGVKEWFQAVNEYGASKGVTIEHYINSSGLYRVIKGTAIFHEFKHVFSSAYIFEDGVASWPAVAVDYTGKTQYLFKINKGIFSISEGKKVNESQAEEDKRVPFSHMIYLGDGQTDVPCMKIVKMFGGYSIGVYNPENEKQKAAAEELLALDRVNYIAPTNYEKSSRAFEIITKIIDKITAEDALKAL